MALDVTVKIDLTRDSDNSDPGKMELKDCGEDVELTVFNSERILKVNKEELKQALSKLD